MRLPFTTGQFFDAFRQYNEAVWPLQVVLAVLAVVCMLLLALRLKWSDTFVSIVLALLWAWLAIAYHLTFFARINAVAYAFAAVSLIGSGLFLWFGVIRREKRFSFRGGVRSAAGIGLAIYALAVYPMLSVLTGHRYPEMPTFGLPCPTTIFTIGMLACLKPPAPRMVFAAPLLWCAAGVQAAFLLGVTQDLALAVAAPIGLWAMFGRTGRGHDSLG
jgi:uncharacterized protein DUF6064